MSRAVKTIDKPARTGVAVRAGGRDLRPRQPATPVTMGHNSLTAEARAWLAGLVASIEREDTAIASANGSKAQLFREAKNGGVDPNALRTAIRWRRNPEQYDGRNAQATFLRQILDEEMTGTQSATRARVLPADGGDE